jgi:hypothetical protein
MAGRPDLKCLNTGTGLWHAIFELEEDKEEKFTEI